MTATLVRLGRMLRPVCFLVLAAFSFAATAHAQAVFSASLSRGIASKIGHTELLGTLEFTVMSGTTEAGLIEINIGPIPFGDISGLTITGTGGLAGTALAAMNDGVGFMSVSVPPGAGMGDKITIAGLRVSVPNYSIITLPALITLQGNSLLAGQTTIDLIRETEDSFYVDPSSDATYIYNAIGLQVDYIGDFIFGEGFTYAFSDTVGQLGRTVPTRITIRAQLLENTQITFPAVIVSQSSAATLTTESGLVEILAHDSPTNEVTYIYDGGPNSPHVIDYFVLQPIQDATGPVEPGTGYFQAYIGPIGTEIPTMELPSTDIPRYELRLLPEFLGPTPESRSFVFPGQLGADTQEVAVSNTSGDAATLTFTAYDDGGALLAGEEIMNPTMLTLLSQETGRFGLTDMFGAGASTGNVASIQVDTLNDLTVATNIGRSAGGVFSSHFQNALNLGLYPFERSGAEEMPVLSLINAGNAVNGEFVLKAADGSTVAQFSQPITEQAAVRGSLADLFGIDPNLVPVSGYVIVRAPGSNFRGEMLSNAGAVPFAAPGLYPSGRTEVTFPFFAVGGGYTTRVVIISGAFNTTGRVTFSAFNAAGIPIGSTERILPPQAKLTFDLAELVPGGPLPEVGYVVVEVDKVETNPFFSVPLTGATIEVATDSLVSVAPLINDPLEEFFFTPSASDDSEYTGLALLNNGTEIADVTIRVYSQDGAFLGSTSVVLPAGTSLVRLLRELIPEVLGHREGVIEITASTNDVQGVAFRGTLDLSELIFLRAQGTP